MRNRQNSLLRILLISSASFTALWFACSAVQKPRFVKTKTLASRIDLSELTPVETKKLEAVLNNEVSPCGDDVTLAEALGNPSHCQLAPRAGQFVIDMVKDDYNIEEISKAYIIRYAALKGLDVPIEGSPGIGASAPRATIVIFTDFECPFCARAAKTLHNLVRRHPDDVLVVYKHFPLKSHPLAEFAARAAYAAQLQDKFWEMHDTLFSAIGSPLKRERIEVMADGLGLDMDKWQEDLASPTATAALTADRKLGEQLSVEGTPTIFLNGRKLIGGVGMLDERLAEEFMRTGKE
jgi:protein-disulfide isomerase